MLLLKKTTSVCPEDLKLLEAELWEIDGQVVPSASDRLRDGVIYRIFRGFEETRPPSGVPFTPRPLIYGENGENPPSGQTSAGTAEGLPLSVYSGENVE